MCCLLAGCGDRKPSGLFHEQETGLHFTHRSGASGKFYMTEIMGAGVALFDYDNDGDLDVFFVQSVGESKLFRNELVPGGKLRFTDVTTQSGIAFRGYGMGAATGDYNNDGFEDLLITGYNSRALYRNNGNGTFTQVDFPRADGVWSTSASFFDYDRDGRLDLIILSYVNFSEAANKACNAPTGEPDYCTPRAYAPVSARLYHNDGGDKFSDVTDKLRHRSGAWSRAWASRPPISTTTGGPICLSPTTRRRTTSGSTSATAPSRKRVSKPARPTAKTDLPRPVWAWPSPMPMATVKKISLSLT